MVHRSNILEVFLSKCEKLVLLAVLFTLPLPSGKRFLIRK